MATSKTWNRDRYTQKIGRKNHNWGRLYVKSKACGSHNTDSSGDETKRCALEGDLVIHNNGDHTFQRSESTSHLDLTLTSRDLASMVKDWSLYSPLKRKT